MMRTHLAAPDAPASLRRPDLVRSPTDETFAAHVDESESQFRLAIDTIPTLVWTARPDGYVDFLNQRWCEYTGLTLEQAVGSGWEAAMCPADLQGLLDTWHGVLSSGAPGEAIARLRRADGEDRWFLFRAVPLYDDAGVLTKWYGETTDIDDRQRLETLLAGEKELLEMIAKGIDLPVVLDAVHRLIGETDPRQREAIKQYDSIASIAAERSFTQAALQESEGRFRQLADTLPEVIWITALHPKEMLYVSPSFEKIWGLPAEALYREPRLWMTTIHDDDRARVIDQFTRWTEGHDVDYSDVEFRIVQPGGAVRWIHERGVLHRGKDGKPFRASGISADITERKRAEERLRRSEAYLAEAQRLSLTGSFTWRPSTEELTWSDETYRIYGFDPTIKPTIDLARQRVHPDDVALFDRTAKATAEQGADLEFAHRLRMPDGSVKYLQIVSTAVRDEVGQVVEYVGAVRDNTERRQAARNLRRAQIRALEARYAAMTEERTRLAREIHDTLLQGFNGVALLLMAAAKKVAEPPEAVTALQHVLDLAQSTLRDARRAVWDLRSPSLEADFPTTLRKAVLEAVRGTAIVPEFVMVGSPRPLAPDVEAATVRVMQEAIANTIKHAAARKVRVRLCYRARDVQVSIRDDGQGFAVDPDFHAYGGHWGLLGMRERASQVGARLKVQSTIGVGTKIAMLLP